MKAAIPAIILLAISPSLHAAAWDKSMDALMKKLPAAIIKAEPADQSKTFKIVRGKCCQEEVRREFVKQGNHWEVRGGYGFEELSSVILNVRREEKNHVKRFIFTVRLMDCKNCADNEFAMENLPGHSEMYKMIGDPVNDTDNESLWINAKWRATLKTEIIDDCPKDGGAC